MDRIAIGLVLAFALLGGLYLIWIGSQWFGVATILAGCFIAGYGIRRTD